MTCKNGHERIEENTFVDSRGFRGCKKCRNIHAAKYRESYLFGDNREKTIQRDGEKCVTCGMTRSEHKAKYGRDITVDHIDKNGSCKPAKLKNNSPDNLATLCVSCHSSKDNTHKKLTDVEIINIRHMKGSVSYYRLAKMYGVSPQYMGQLMAGKWRRYYDHAK